MSNHHMKRLNTPRTLRVHRKEKKWTIRQLPGPHPIDKSISLGVLIRDYLHLCDTRREARRILSQGLILIDGVICKELRYPIGFMDVISLPSSKKYYRCVYNQRGNLSLVPISTSDAEWKLRRIEKQSILKEDQIQLNFHDGTNMIIKDKKYHIGDVLKIKLKDSKITDVFPREKGTISFIIGGSHIGEMAVLDEISVIKSSNPNVAKMTGDQQFTTLEQYVFPIGKTKPVITIPEVKIQ
ncbi:MAG: 30S ribosomal protein S4e [Candidatus Thermoplasmatota archaeon]|nr:30S ribosomal protein S4e [Candidatus Thermoplasmatota archaeon]MBS3801189.1 30S ribosomal protein S4e [Candidatus Thermoplasmatota archaeon]